MRRKIGLSKKGLAFRTNDKRVSLSMLQNVVTLFTHFAQLGQVLRLRLGLTMRLTNTFRLGSAQDDGISFQKNSVNSVSIQLSPHPLLHIFLHLGPP